MTFVLTPLTPVEVEKRLTDRRAVLVDIREPDEFARRHVCGALSRPLSIFEQAHLKIEPGRDVIFTCRSGLRTVANCDRLAKGSRAPPSSWRAALTPGLRRACRSTRTAKRLWR